MASVNDKLKGWSLFPSWPKCSNAQKRSSRNSPDRLPQKGKGKRERKIDRASSSFSFEMAQADAPASPIAPSLHPARDCSDERPQNGQVAGDHAAWNIPIHYDLALGELVSPDSLIQLINALHSLRDPLRLDHAALLAWMQGMSPKNKIRKLLPYSKLIEREIARIAQLSQPERTTQAYQFWKRYKSARFVSHAIDRVNLFVGKKKSQDAERERGFGK